MTPIRTGFIVFVGNFDDRAEIVVVLPAHADVSGIDAVLVQGPRALRIFREEDVPVVMKIPDDRVSTPRLSESSDDFRYGAAASCD